jgi:hypothetical protein
MGYETRAGKRCVIAITIFSRLRSEMLDFNKPERWLSPHGKQYALVEFNLSIQ